MITEAMSVNNIVKTHPEAQAIFQRFRIDCGTDGISYLDELCWWRGIEVEGLLQTLQEERVPWQRLQTGGKRLGLETCEAWVTLVPLAGRLGS